MIVFSPTSTKASAQPDKSFALFQQMYGMSDKSIDLDAFSAHELRIIWAAVNTVAENNPMDTLVRRETGEALRVILKKIEESLGQ